MLRRQKHALSGSTTPFACTLSPSLAFSISLTSSLYYFFFSLSLSTYLSLPLYISLFALSLSLPLSLALPVCLLALPVFLFYLLVCFSSLLITLFRFSNLLWDSPPQNLSIESSTPVETRDSFFCLPPRFLSCKMAPVRCGCGSRMKRFERSQFSLPTVPVKKGFLCVSVQLRGKARTFRQQQQQNKNNPPADTFLP